LDFLERLFHVSPDGGSGSLELMYIVAAVAAGVAFSLRRFIASALPWRRDRSKRPG
jgi:hypothetical protein